MTINKYRWAQGSLEMPFHQNTEVLGIAVCKLFHNIILYFEGNNLYTVE